MLCCALALGCMQVGCAWLARGLHLRLERRAMALGLALPVILLAPWLFGGSLLAPTGTLDRVLPGVHADRAHLTHLVMSDATYQFLPWELEVRHALRRLRLPLWSDRLDGGSSPWVNPQAAVLSPIAMLARLGRIQHFLLLCLALKILVGCEGTWLLARRLGCGRVAAVVAAASFSLGGGMTSWALFPHSAAVAWVPWLTLGTIVVCRRPTARALATTALIAAALLLAGHPETALAGALFAAVCGLGLRRRRIGWRRSLAAAGLAALVGGGLAAPLLVPFLRAVPGSQRSRDMLAAGMPAYDFHALRPASWFLPAYAAYLRAPFSPRAYGLPYGERFDGPFDWVDALSGYAGLAALGGAAVAGLALRDRRARPFLGFAAVALLVVAGFLPFARLIHAVPALRVPVWSRLLPVACLGLAVAAAFGWDLLLRGRGARVGGARGGGAADTAGGGANGSGRLRRAWPRWQAGAALAAAAGISLAVDHSPWVILLWALLVAAPLAARLHPGAGALALAAALALDLIPWSQRLLPRGEAGLFYPPNPLTTVLARETGGGAWRSVGLDLMVYPSVLPVYGLAELRPNNVLAPTDQLDVLRLAFGFAPTASNYYASFATADHPLLSFLAVRAVVGNVNLRPPRTLAALSEPEILPFVVYRNERALPRWFVPTAVDVIEPAELARWIGALADPGRVAVYRDQLGGWTPPPPPPAPPPTVVEAEAAIRPPTAMAEARTPRTLVATPWLQAASTPAVTPEVQALRSIAMTPRVQAARALAATPGHIELEVPGQGARRLLATSLPSPAGWRAAGGGRKLVTLTVNGAFLGVLCPAGVSRITVDYLPPGLAAGMVLFTLALAALGVLGFLAWKAGA